MLKEKFVMDDIEMRKAYCAALISEAEINDKIVAVDADVQYSMGTKPFYEKFPNRGINCGIMEAHAVGFSAGLSATGMIPFFHAFGTFATRRAYDQVFLSCAYQDLNVKIIGGDAGVTAAANGGTHMPFEDMGIMRNIPRMTIIEPADSVMYKDAVKFMANTYGNFYLRSNRRKAYRIYQDNARFVIGKANLLKEGDDVAVIACGIMVYQALLAYEMLKKEGISVMVIDMHTIKPIDKDIIKYAAKRCKAVVTAENHNIINGLGSAVAEVLSEECPSLLKRVGVKDEFGEVGDQEYLMQRFNLTAEDIYKAVKKCLKEVKNESSSN
ncbi:MAG: transketolase family protein [Bacillota bacterium]